eukprot:COSAG01_NODE_1028_length_12028_cov_5.688826_2_plen_119_part_00
MRERNRESAKLAEEAQRRLDVARDRAAQKDFGKAIDELDVALELQVDDPALARAIEAARGDAERELQHQTAAREKAEVAFGKGEEAMVQQVRGFGAAWPSPVWSRRAARVICAAAAGA